MDDVAARAGVSRTLVSLVLSGKPGAGEATRERVLDAARELGYQPNNAARLLARERSRTIGVLLDIRQPFEADLVAELYPLVEAAGYELLLSVSAPGRGERKAAEALLGHSCEALILLGPGESADYLLSLADRAVVAVLGRKLPPDRVDSIRTADGKGVRMAVDHLVGLGHRAIWHVDGGDGPGAAERRDAYRAGMHAHGLDAATRVLPGAHDEAAGIAAAELIGAADPMPTAVIASNDRCAFGVMFSLSRQGVDVPGDVSVVGFDDDTFSGLLPIGLTTVRQDAPRLAEQAVRLVSRRLEDPSAEPVETVLEPELVLRGTHGPPRLG